MRLNKFISLCGFASRRAADELIKEQKVSVNGEIVQDLGRQIQESDLVEIEGKKLSLPQKTTVIAFHKPAGCVCTCKDPQKRQTVYDFLPPGYKGLKYIGRLDLQSRGLLLFTDDGELAHRLTLPKYKILRHYLVWTDSPVKKSDAEQLIEGIDLEDGIKGFAEAVFFEEGCIELVLSEGKNREIRKMMAAIGYEIEDLQRIAYADIDLGDLASGDYRELSDKEIQLLKKSCGL
ncbi:MAG: pseudouridine synthase [Fibrobacteraceae bacterium]|jgi:23S rRNA pseudouridine2605 synthase|nr:pseudouridine synthase [Fibrobacteraceae bacterium]